MTAVGVARPRASGQVTTTTVIANSSASLAGRPSAIHARKVTRPPTRATRTSQNAARSASRWPGALEFWASWTIATICARAVSRPTLVARTRSDPVVFTDAPMTSEPAVTATGTDSPVTIDSSISETPSSTTPSTGTFAPGRTSSRSPTTTSAVSTSTQSSPRCTSAFGGASSSKVRIASFAPPRARISNQCPRSTNVVRTAAAS